MIAVLLAFQLAAGQSADDALRRGIELARSQQWAEARTVLLAGSHRYPRDPRFPVEMGGVAFRQKQPAEAARWLRRALRLNPTNAYAIDFLGTIYFLQGNLDAALKYWNRIDKPEVRDVAAQPDLRVDPVLLDRAFTFSPAAILRAKDLLNSRARVAGLEIFPLYDIRLEARDDGKFDVRFAASERNGFGSSTAEALVSAFRGVGFQAAHLEYSNMGRVAVNSSTLVRWDAQKRRVNSTLSGPLGINPLRRYRIGVDFRRENWELRGSSAEIAEWFGSLGLSRGGVSAEVVQFAGAGWGWSGGGEFSHRDYFSVITPAEAAQSTLLKGFQAKAFGHARRALWRAPERRLESLLSVSAEAARIWTAPSNAFQKMQASVATRWFPRLSGDDYAVQHQVRTGRIFGHPPFDELYMLGLERDNDLWMRAHPGTANGRKGSAPLGSAYFLSNWEIDKALYGDGLFSIKLSPFIDVGRAGGNAGFNNRNWLWDTGAQLKLRALGVGFTLIYGKDLRSGQNTFYVTASR